MMDYIKDSPEDLPDNLLEFCYYREDFGYVIMAVSQYIEYEARKSGDPWLYEQPVPCDYILKSGYRIVRFKDSYYITCDIEPERFINI